MGWYVKALKKYAKFSGRARRKEYWMFVLFNMIFAGVAIVLDSVLGLSFKVGDISMYYGYIYLIYMLLMIIPALAVMVRRLHDIDKSGGWFFIAFVPIIGAIWLLVLMCTAGTQGPNKFGDDPKTEM